ncbi:unnamed protein product [Blepharisma stoltei]|uniref:Uncharacterized protein n=1 Tax=Blepharisma stoltei TaxID=1481888 RepID=A0AAU9IR74_9CILI|nr:unnamed protein product [Blepharisma stoltei]
MLEKMKKDQSGRYKNLTLIINSDLFSNESLRILQIVENETDFASCYYLKTFLICCMPKIVVIFVVIFCYYVAIET